MERRRRRAGGLRRRRIADKGILERTEPRNLGWRVPRAGATRSLEPPVPSSGGSRTPGCGNPHVCFGFNLYTSKPSSLRLPAEDEDSLPSASRGTIYARADAVGPAGWAGARRIP